MTNSSKLLPGLVALCGAMAFLSQSAMAQNHVEFTQPYAPSEGFVAAPEKPFRQDICLDGRWQFQPVPIPAGFKSGTGTPPEMAAPATDRWETTAIKIPSPWNVNTWGNGRDAGDGTSRPYVADSLYYPSYPASWDGVQMGWLRRSFRVPATWTNKRVVLHFEAVAGEAQVLVNGQPAGHHFDSFLPFDLDVTDLVKRDGENELLVGVRKSELFNIVSVNYPEHQQRTYPNGSNTDNLVGIWRDVFLLGLPPVRVDNAFIQPLVNQDALRAKVTLRNDSTHSQTVRFGGEVKPWVNLAGKDVLSAPVPKWRLDPTVLTLTAQSVTIAPGKTATVILSVKVGEKLKFWSPDTPNLYGAVFKATGAGGAVLDQNYVRFGWRQFQIQGRDILLNGKKIQLTGDFLHPFGPYMDSRRFVWQFYKMIKDMGGNSTRPHAQVHPRVYLEMADEMGLCVLDEGAVFGSSINLNLKEAVTWQRLQNHIDNLVLRDRNHPSVFGWSPGNEMFALFFKTEKEERDREYVLLKALAQRPLQDDPTRPWVSVDGDEDLEGTLPTWSKHMGTGVPNGVPAANKPWMIGEHGGTYYAGPPRLTDINGDKSYESYAARNQALAIDLYRMITTVAKPNLAVFSPSELGWFGLEHLPFGYRTDTRPPSKADGIFFPNFQENTPGVQIERLPPYVMTVNPGLDPTLPAYKTMAMFDAMKAAMHKGGPLPSPWNHLPVVTPRVQPAPTNAINEVAFAGNKEGALFSSLYSLGVPLVTGEAAVNCNLLIIDGETLSTEEAEAATHLAKAIWARGGLVWVMMRDQGAALPQLQNLLGKAVNLTARKATSLARGEASPAIDGFGLDGLYFVAQEGDSDIQKAGLEGPLVQGGKTLLTASNSDWSLFERQPESAKTSSMLIYEHLKKPAGAALVEIPKETGKLWVSTLDATTSSKTMGVFWTQLLRNVGVKMRPIGTSWLVQVGRDAEVNWRYIKDTPSDSWVTPDFDDTAWTSGQTGFGDDVPNSKVRTNWDGPDIYLRHEFTLDQLPRTLRLIIHHDEDVQVYLNGTQVFRETGFLSDYKTVPLKDDAVKALHAGRNVIAVHCHQTDGGQYIDAGLATDSVPTAADGAGHDLLLDGPVN